MIERADVERAYRDVLGRPPESEAAIEAHLAGHRSVADMRTAFARSEEARARPGMPPAPPGTTLGPGDLDAFVLDTDRLGPPGSPEVEAFWAGLSYRPRAQVDETLDPYGEAYVDQQVAVYQEISGRDLDQARHEMSFFDPAPHVTSPNPYAHWTPALVALHVGRVSRAVQHAGLGFGQHVLDMGCGWGSTSEAMAFLGLRVTGVDINPDFVALVNRRAARLGNGIEARVGSFDAIPGDEAFDAALFYESLHHAVRPWLALAAVHARLRPGGTLMLAGEPVNDMWRHWGIRTDMTSVYFVRKFGWFESGWSVAFLRDCVARCGFEVDHFAAEPHGIGWVMTARKPG